MNTHLRNKFNLQILSIDVCEKYVKKFQRNGKFYKIQFKDRPPNTNLTEKRWREQCQEIFEKVVKHICKENKGMLHVQVNFSDSD